MLRDLSPLEAAQDLAFDMSHHPVRTRWSLPIIGDSLRSKNGLIPQ
jgi:hypothetical protein